LVFILASKQRFEELKLDPMVGNDLGIPLPCVPITQTTEQANKVRNGSRTAHAMFARMNKDIGEKKQTTVKEIGIGMGVIGIE
jgi:hypothetical protein